MKHHNQVVDFANLDFEAIDTETLIDETKEKEGEIVADIVEGDGTTIGGVMDEAYMDEGHVEEVITAPWKKIFNNLFWLLLLCLFFFRTLVASCFEALTQRQ